MLVVCALMTIPLAWAMMDDIHHPEVKAFAISIVFGLVISSACLYLFRFKKNDFKKINAKDGLAIVGLSWIVLSAFGSLPIFLSGEVPTFTDAFFETASGFTTTGATIVTDLNELSLGILFWRSLTHWLGGMGIIVLYIALLPAIGANTFQLYKAEAPGLDVERIEPRIQETAKKLWFIYLGFTVVLTILLMFGGMSLFDALCHTFGTIATGGFSTQNTSIAGYSSYIQWVIILFMFLAGINFILHFQLIRGRVKNILQNEEFRIYLAIILGCTLISSVVLGFNGLTEHPVRDSAFQVVSILTTTGFVTADFDLWPNALRIMFVLIMFIGACGGSTGGGMKIVRFFLSIKIAARSIIQTVLPNSVISIKFNEKPLSEKVAMAVLGYFTIYMFLFLFGATMFTITESCDLITSLTASVSALSNIGPGLGKIGPVENYAWVSTPGKWLLTFLMLAGRLELYSILILFIPSTWKK